MSATTRRDYVYDNYIICHAVLQDLPERLREAREKLGLTCDAAARQIGVSRRTLGNVEAGDNMRIVTAMAIIAWLAELQRRKEMGIREVG